MTHKPAHFIFRVLASCIDTLLFSGLHVYFWGLLARSNDIQTLASNLMLYLIVVVVSPVGLLYQILPTYWFGGTLGKILTGIRINTEDGGRLSLKRVLFRQTIGYTFSWLFFGLGYLAILKDDKRQGWHDKAVGSVVTQTGAYWLVGLAVLILLTGGVGYFGMKAAQTAINNEPLKGSFMEIYGQIQANEDGKSLVDDAEQELK